MMIKKKADLSLPEGLTRSRSELIYVSPFFAILILHVIGAIWPTYSTWGFNYWSLFDLRLSLSILLLSCLLMIPAISANIWKMFGLIFARPARLLKNLSPYFSRLPISIALLCLFFFLRSRAHIYGDGYLILSFYSSEADITIGGQLYFQVFSIFLYRLVIPGLTGPFGISVDKAFALINSAAGVAGFWAIYALAGRLTCQMRGRIFLLCSALTSGSVISFFGYIETYTLPTVLGLWTLYFALGYIQNRNGWLPLVICGLLSFSLHMITLPFLFIVFLAIILHKIKIDRLPFNLTYWQAGLGFVLGVVVFAIISQSTGLFKVIGLTHVFVPSWPVSDKPYWFLSLDHLCDMLNLCLLVAPLGLTLSMFCLFSGKCSSTGVNHEEKLLGALALITFLVSFWIDPLLGIVRDWDLLSFFGFPLSIWAAYRFSKLELFKNNAPSFIAASIVVMLVHIGPNLYEKNHIEIAAEHLDDMVWQCPHYQEDYLDAYRAMSWGNLLMTTQGRDDLAAKYFHRRLSVDKNTASVWSNLAYIYSKRGMIDSSAYYMTQAVTLNPNNSSYLLRLAYTELLQGRLYLALRYITRGEILAPNDPDILRVKEVILQELKRSKGIQKPAP
jgi:hypothetical protein